MLWFASRPMVDPSLATALRALLRSWRMRIWLGFSALLSVARVGSVDATVGRDIVLSGVAAAVVGGVSLFGGKGRLMHAAIGALVIATITNGLGLLNLPAGINLLVTGGVLILAATVDALSRVRSGGVRM